MGLPLGGDLRVESAPCLFQHGEVTGHCIPRVVAVSLWPLLLWSKFSSLTLTLLPLMWTLLCEPWVYQIIQDNHRISRSLTQSYLPSLVPRKVTCPRVQELGRGHLGGGGHFFGPTTATFNARIRWLFPTAAIPQQAAPQVQGISSLTRRWTQATAVRAPNPDTRPSGAPTAVFSEQSKLLPNLASGLKGMVWDSVSRKHTGSPCTCAQTAEKASDRMVDSCDKRTYLNWHFT